MDPLALDFWIGIGLAFLCGTIVGLERRARDKPAGIRTSVLVVLGTYIYVSLGTTLSGKGADPTRILGQVIAGIGFLGAGVILARGGEVTGVTSAATIWVLAAIGATIGLGHRLGAIALSILTVAILAGLSAMESLVRKARGEADRADSEDR